MVAGSADPRPGYFRLLNQLRGLAALLVVWAHLVGHWLAMRGLPWAPTDQLERFVMKPLNIIQHFGFLGVGIFFLISGFVVTRAATIESTRTFVVRRLLRIYPPLIGAVGLSLAAVAIATPHGWDAGIDPAVLDSVSFGNVVRAMTLVGYATVPQVVVVDVAWTLIIEMIFYILLACFGPVLRSARLPDWTATAAMTAIVIVVLALGRSLGDEFFLLSVSFSYVPLLLLGHVLYLVTQRSMNRIVGGGLAAALWMTFVWGVERIQPTFLAPENSYGSSLTIAVTLVVVAVLAERHARPNRFMDAVAARSYSLYLVHGPVGLLVLDAVWQAGVAYRWALLAALAATAAGVELMYQGLERPSIRIARRLTRAVRAGAAPPPEPASEPVAQPTHERAAEPEAGPGLEPVPEPEPSPRLVRPTPHVVLDRGSEGSAGTPSPGPSTGRDV